MSIKAVGELVQHYAPPVQNSKYSTWIPSIAKNLTRIAVPIIMLVVMDSLSQVEAGPLSYSACCLSCSVLAPPAVPGCLMLCAPVIFFPSP